MKTFPSPVSTAVTHLFATAYLLKPLLFGSASRTGPPSTADARKSPSTVDGRMRENEMFGCSMERDWYKRSAADFVDA